MAVARRLGQSPQLRCTTDVNCPDFFELADGRIAVIGALGGDDVHSQLPTDAGIGADERLVVVPRDIWLAAVADR